MVHRGIATLAGLLMFCFFLLSHLDPGFFLYHLYQSLIFLVIILMLFYFEDHYAYMLGMIAPSAWLLLIFATGLLGGAMSQFWMILTFRIGKAVPVTPGIVQHEAQFNPVSFLAGITALLAVAMIGFCAQRWKREYAGSGKGLTTFLVSLGIVVVYYGVMILFFIREFPFPAR
jgi:hypothetical protein